MDEKDRRLLRVQATSGLVFALFLGAHLANQALAALGATAYDGAQRTLRRGYQWAPAEIALVLAPLLVHAGAGIARLVRRRRRGAPGASSLTQRLHRASALVLLVFFVGHVAATRGASLLYGVFPGFEGVAFTLKWVPAYFWPYYLLFSVAGAIHLVIGVGIALPLVGLRRVPWPRRSRTVAAVCALAALALAFGMLGLGGVIADAGHPERSAYAQLLRRLGVAHAAADRSP